MKQQFLVLTCLAVALTSCHTSPESRYYELSSPIKNNPRIDSSAVSKVTIPTLLDRPQIVMQTGNNEIHILEYSRWAEPLDKMIRRVLADDLSAHQARKRRIIVTIDEFMANESGQVTLRANWSVEPAGTKDVSAKSPTHTFQESLAANDRDMDSIVSTMSRLIDDLAQSISGSGRS